EGAEGISALGRVEPHSRSDHGRRVEGPEAFQKLAVSGHQQHQGDRRRAAGTEGTGDLTRASARVHSYNGRRAGTAEETQALADPQHWRHAGDGRGTQKPG